MGSVLFDFAGTLADLVPDSAEIVLEQVMERTGIQLPAQRVNWTLSYLDTLFPYSSVRTTSQEKREKYYLDYNHALLTLLGVAHVLNAQDLYESFTGTERHWKLRPEARQIVDQLKDEGARVSLISNFDSRLVELVNTELGLGGCFDDIFVSQIEGLEKPNPAFYKEFLGKYQLDPEQVLYCGDSYTLDYLPTIHLGMQSLLLDNHNFYSFLDDAICSLSEIIPIYRSLH